MMLGNENYPTNTAVALSLQQLFKHEDTRLLHEKISSRMVRCASVLDEDEFIGWQMVVAIVCISGILLAVNIAVSIWRYQATPWFSMDYAYTRVVSLHAMAISIGVLVALMIQLLNSKGKEWFAIPAYAALLCFGTYIAVFGIDGRYLGGRVTYFTPAMMYAALFVS